MSIKNEPSEKMMLSRISALINKALMLQFSQAGMN